MINQKKIICPHGKLRNVGKYGKCCQELINREKRELPEGEYLNPILCRCERQCENERDN